MVKAAHVALGQSSTVIVREQTRGMSDDDAIDIGKTLHANAVAEIAWSDSKRLRVTVHVHVDGATRWIDRDLGFVNADAPTERGRAVGFTIASMLPERAQEDDPPPPPPAPPPKAPPPPVDVPPPAPSNEAVRVPEPPRVWRGAFEAAALGSVGIAGYGGGLGAALGIRYNLGSGFALRVGGGARGGDVPPAQATSLFVFGAAGLAWATVPRPVGFGIRADLLLTRLQLSHFSADDPTPVRQSRWIGGGATFFEATWFFSQSAGIFAALGAEYAFGSSDVIVANKAVAVVPVVRGVSEIGLRARF